MAQGDFRGQLFNDLVELTGDRNVIERMLEGLLLDWPAGRTAAWEKHVGDKLKRAGGKKPGTMRARLAKALEMKLNIIFMGGGARKFRAECERSSPATTPRMTSTPAKHLTRYEDGIPMTDDNDVGPMMRRHAETWEQQKVLRDFLEFLADQKGVVLAECSSEIDDHWWPSYGRDKYIAEFFKIDLQQLDVERRELLAKVARQAAGED